MTHADIPTPMNGPWHPRRSALAITACVLGLAVLGASCGTEVTAGSSGTTGEPDTNATVTTSGTQTPSLWGRRFTTKQLTIANDTVNLAEPGLTLDFSEPGRVTANAGCNTMSAVAKLNGTSLSFEDIASTEIGCTEPLQRNDQLVQRLLATPLEVSIDGDSLTITGASASATMRTNDPNGSATDDSSIEGSSWVIDTLISGDVAASVPADITDASLLLDGGRLSMQLCNAVSATYRLDADVLHVSDISSTKKLCAADVNDFESDVLSVLRDSPSVSLEDGRLVLASGDGPDATQIVLAR